MLDSLDRDFSDFRRTRDPAALAAVFDAAAPRLLLVAMHLCRDAATAEDLVQTVFLQVLRDVDRFDPRRPVMPWLFGVLEHRASDLRQRAHVRRERAIDAAAANAIATAPPPERSAADGELRERVAQALAGMPRDYRDVLTLRLVHGLSAVAIAHAHGVPPATVRTRLRRGLELLRGALPRGLATPGLLALLGAEMLRASDGLAAVRATVLAAAGGGVAVGFGAWLAVGAAVLALVAGWFCWPTHADVAPAQAARVDAASGGVASHEPGAPGSPTPIADREPAPQREAVRETRLSMVRGRLVDAATQQPLAAAKVTLRGFVERQGVERPADWRDPPACETGADGAFAFTFVPASVLSLEIGFEAPRHVDDSTSLSPLREGATVDVGDVALQPGTPVCLRVRCDGRAMAGMCVSFGPEQEGGRPRGMGIWGPSNAEGAIDLGVCPPGVWHYEVQTNRIANEGKLTVPAQGDVFEHTIDLRMPPRAESISGTLVDQRGEPVAGVTLGIRSEPGYATATTEPDGTFVWRWMAEAKPARIEVFDRRQDLEWIDDGGEVPAGKHELRLVVRRRAPASLRFEVTDGATGRPVESFGAAAWLDCWRLRRGGPELGRAALAEHAGGIECIADLPPGPYFASVFPPPPYAEHAEVAIELAEGKESTLRVALQRPAELVVDVVDAATRAPAPGVDIALAKVLPAAHHALVTLDTFRTSIALARGRVSYSSGPNVLDLARGRSDDAGRVRLLAPPDVQALVLYAEGPRCVRTLRRDVALPLGGNRIVVEVQPASEVRGTLGPQAFVDAFGPERERVAAAAASAATQLVDSEEFRRDYPSVQLRPVGGAPATRFEVHTNADGAFAIGSVPQGTYDVWVEVVGSSAKGHESFVLGPLRTIELPAAAREPLRIDLAAHAPAFATLRVFVDGEPWRGAAGLARLDGAYLAQVVCAADAGGVHRSPALRPGTYVPFASVRDDRGSTRCIFGSERFVIAVGTTSELIASLVRRVVRVRVVDASGQPVPDLMLRLEALDHPELAAVADRFVRTGSDGVRVFDPAPPGRLRVGAFKREQIAANDHDAEPALLLGEIAADGTSATFALPR